MVDMSAFKSAFFDNTNILSTLNEPLSPIILSALLQQDQVSVLIAGFTRQVYCYYYFWVKYLQFQMSYSTLCDLIDDKLRIRTNRTSNHSYWLSG